jgi:hypothetical protein
MSARIENEIMEHLKRLPMTERLRIVESLAHQLHENLQLSSGQVTQEVGGKLARAAKALREDYLEDKELTAFTALDSEAFHALR